MHQVSASVEGFCHCATTIPIYEAWKCGREYLAKSEECLCFLVEELALFGKEALVAQLVSATGLVFPSFLSIHS